MRRAGLDGSSRQNVRKPHAPASVRLADAPGRGAVHSPRLTKPSLNRKAIRWRRVRPSLTMARASRARRTDDVNLIRHFLAGYTENFLLALVLWPFASVVLTLPILAWVYHRDGRPRFGTVVSTYLAVLYVLGLGCFTLWPLPSGNAGPGISYGIPWQLDPLAFVRDFAREGASTLPQIAFNVVLFMPLGFIAGRLLRWGLWRSVVVGLLASLAIEVAQGTGLFGVYPYAYRTADVDDLILNLCGASIGFPFGLLAVKLLDKGDRET